MLSLFAIATLASTALVARADPLPSAPGPGDVFKVGQPCTMEWTPDTTGVWKTMNIELMTGSNLGMVHLTTVATVDGTDASLTTFSYTCPEVTPNSAIYFYQFSSPGTGGAVPQTTWTTRFTIAAADGTTTEPTEANQPSNPTPAIPWGTGALTDPSTAVAAPGAVSASGSSSAGVSTSGSASSSVAAVTSTSASSSVSHAAVAATASSISTRKLTSATSAAAASASSGAANQASGAVGRASGSGVVMALAGLVAYFL